MLAQSTYQRREKEERLEGVKSCYEQIVEKKQCVSLKSLAVTGRDLIQAGYKPGLIWEKFWISFWSMFWNIRKTIRRKR